MSKLPPIPSWIPGSDLLHPTFRYTTPAIPSTVDELHKLFEPKTSLYAFVAMTAFNPVFWNFVARNEYRNKTITKVVRSPLVGCYLLAITIFSISAFRDHLFLGAVKDQPSLAILGHPAIKAAAIALFASGQTFVITSMWALGVTGTYLGDYFGILMSHRVTSFPFNVLSDPMYVGSFLTHLGTALWFQSPAGIVLAAWVWIVYAIALKFEGPFTDKIYSAKNKKTDGDSSSPVPTPTSASFPATPSRRSGRLAAKASAPNSDADSDSGSASAAPIKATPRKTARKSVARGEVATPRRVTRSRSQGLASGVSGEE
ncbi:methylene-fatty-acyl-phospholipid synthase [Cryptococcus gattii Ru294]|uniref:Phosphatidyl-N-methylethanolamine N-methyltransferase n=2 Tax=Cryptococcus gattii TaxID=37769 RepID=E6RBN9_CRYGW|nr:phosphatidyl-N-methylethanolamine N-methyltransferase, putative [Cryptococcus gattii WM276]KIR54371.1 methylene-fatty-acyl-phospholipid synthase [Cryptococcus gattii Ru294]KIR76460.1 methylene-fatty-acyl-phospholipid synthase [Cryptococcus gattii EJB2]KIY30967.1 methylene-fatty-acyl-phospholipid synthase [Cryptococcus gattii E566]KJE00990.1 methylene-fatty-acyl-phospholipid synthase [Cryptococcus gattii NT-10]ADV24242.1 phosphatidyl-N-methylethanolamine N-methyltransferase, putative [Crypto